MANNNLKIFIRGRSKELGAKARAREKCIERERARFFLASAQAKNFISS